MPTGDKSENLRKAITCYEAALTVRTKAADPTNWAVTQNNLGFAWGNMPTGDKADNLRKAIAYFEAALTVRTKTADPAKWAMTQMNVGSAWNAMPGGDRTDNLCRVIASLKGGLLVYAAETFPNEHREAVAVRGRAKGIRIVAGCQEQTLR